MNLTEFRLYKGQPGVGEGPGRTSRLGALGCIQRRGPGSAGFPTTRGVGPAAWSPGFLADGESLLKPAGMRLPSPLLLQGRISFRQIRGVDLGVPCRLAPSPPSAARRRQDAASRGVLGGSGNDHPAPTCPSRESLSGGLREPSTCPRHCWHRARASPLYRTLETCCPQARGHFLPPTSSFQPLLADPRG